MILYHTECLFNDENFKMIIIFLIKLNIISYEMLLKYKLQISVSLS